MTIASRSKLFWVGLLLLCLTGGSVRANVYATDIRLNGSLNAGVIFPGSRLSISYILNDNATAGVSVLIWSGTNVVKSFAATNGEPGTLLGLNSFLWDGTNDDGSAAAGGIYTVSITAASAGYGTWTNITDDGTNFMAWAPRGVSVNRNTNSPYYGRVFVANATTDPSGSGPGAQVGIIKCTADGSQADEGGFSNGGLSWGSAMYPYDYSPWKIAISADDEVYIDDYSESGVVYGFDQTISTNQILEVLGMYNYPTNLDPYPQLSGVCVTGTGTNKEIWMPDYNPNGSAGILRWEITSSGTVATNDTGVVIVPVTSASPLSNSPYDIAIDSTGIIYAIQFLLPTSEPGMVVMSYAPYAGTPETNALWAIGSGDTNLLEAYGIAVDPTGTLLAVAIRGGGGSSQLDTGFLNLYSATNGQLLRNLDTTGGDQYTDVAWDNVGNLYALDTSAQVWRVYSPPGLNQAKTVAAPFIQRLDALLPPALCDPSCGAGGLSFTLVGQSNVTYVIQQSPDLVNWNSVATNYSPNPSRPISIPFADNQDFYRALYSQ